MEEEVPCSLKRQREEEGTEKFVDGEVEELLKKQKSIRDIISILEEDEDEPDEDISSLITTLQQEISPSSSLSESSVSDCLRTTGDASTTVMTAELNTSSTVPAPTKVLGLSSSFSSKDFDEEEMGEDVMRHLLEASDDELGIPNHSDVVASDYSGGEEGRIGKEELLIDGGGGGQLFDFGFGGGMWEFEDETANYYAMLQSELFLEAGV